MSAVVAFPLPLPSVRHPRAGFEIIPQDISRTELLRYFTFSDNDLEQVRQCRGDINRLGFALLLSGVRLTGRFPHDFELISPGVLKHVCDQLAIAVPLFISYPPGGRRPTRHEHIERIKTYLGLRSFLEEDKALRHDYIDSQVIEGSRPHELLDNTERMLRDQHVTLPGVTVLEKLIRSARSESEEKLYLKLYERIDAETKDRILGLFQIEAGQHVSTFQRLRRASRGPSAKALERELDSLEVVRYVLPVTLDLTDVNTQLLERMASVIAALPTYAIAQFPEQKRVALLLCWFWRLRTQITDTALTINNDLTAGMFRRAKNKSQERRKLLHKRFVPVIQVCGEVVNAVLDQSILDTDLRANIIAQWSEERLTALSIECQELGPPIEAMYMEELRSRYNYLRQFAPRLLESFALQASNGNSVLIDAVEYLKACNRHDKKFVEEDAPVAFIPIKWQAQVCPEPGKVDRQFTKITSGRPVKDGGTAEVLKLLTCLIAEACNINMTDMELVGPGFDTKQLEDVHFNYLREETLAKAAATRVNFHLGQWLTLAWGQGHTSSSDAKVYGVPVSAINAAYHPKYFASAGRGVAIYTHISDLWIPFYTQVITCHVRQAPYMLDGLLYHATRLEPKEHYTDTHGYTDAIFGISHLLGIRFAPRIKDLPEMRLWRLPNHTHYKHISSVFSGRINIELIRESWDDIIRLIASIKTGKVRASLIATKVAAAGHSSKLYRGIQELGRVFKTAHIAQYLFDELLRRRVLQGLNKGESIHSLAGDVRFVKKGELRDLTLDDQLNAASSLNLVLAAIIVWNTVHMQACIKKIEADGPPIDKENLRFLSPTIRKHIGIYGQYRFDVDRLEFAPSPEKLTY